MNSTINQLFTRQQYNFKLTHDWVCTLHWSIRWCTSSFSHLCLPPITLCAEAEARCMCNHKNPIDLIADVLPHPRSTHYSLCVTTIWHSPVWRQATHFVAGCWCDFLCHFPSTHSTFGGKHFLRSLFKLSWFTQICFARARFVDVESPTKMYRRKRN